MPVSISVPLPILVGLPVPEIVPENVARKLARSAIGDGWGAQRQAFAFIESPLRLEKLLKACGEPRLGNGLEGVGSHLPVLEPADDDGPRGKIDHGPRAERRDHLAQSLRVKTPSQQTRCEGVFHVFMLYSLRDPRPQQKARATHHPFQPADLLPR
jgi:hypothetical protein